jgi:hypothetical protein
MKSTRKNYELVSINDHIDERFFIRKFGIENIWCTGLFSSPKRCFTQETAINRPIEDSLHEYQYFLNFFRELLSQSTQTIVAEAQTLEDLKLQVPEYFI